LNNVKVNHMSLNIFRNEVKVLLVAFKKSYLSSSQSQLKYWYTLESFSKETSVEQGTQGDNQYVKGVGGTRVKQVLENEV